MGFETLYRKYRPKNFSEIIGQKHIVQTLSNAIKNDRVGQAYLFTGPRGTGKTSIARIFAKTINCKHAKDAITCEKCPACRMISDGKSLDIIEIDAASNTGVDNIRELRETINLPPTSLKYKVYIIDEVHMLSSGAFNALLKTLEEPPAHVIFILATTEIHKVPETILSRCQRFDFTRLPIQNIIEKLTLIANAEKIKINNDSLEMIAIAAEGGMRDAESLFGQVIALEDKNITVKEVEEILGTADRKFSYELVEMIIENDVTGAIAKINDLLNDGYDLAIFNKSLVNYLRQLMLLKISPDLKSSFAYEITTEQLERMSAQTQKIDLKKIIITINLFMDAQEKISSFLLSQLPLEIAIIKATRTFPATQPEAYSTQQLAKKSIAKNINQANREPLVTRHKQDASIQNLRERYSESSLESAGRSEQAQPVEILNELKNDNKNAKQILAHDIQSNWSRLLDAVKPLNHSLQALLFSCQIVTVEKNVVTLATPYDFYKEKLNNPTNRLIVEKVFSEILDSKVTIKAIVNKEAGIKIPEKNLEASDQADKQSSLLTEAINIMGGKVVKE